MNETRLSSAKNRKLERLYDFIEAIYHSKESSFYKSVWGNVNPKDGRIDYYSLPTIDVKHIIQHEFDKRLYVKNGLFVKVVYGNDIPFLIAVTKDSIGQESYGGILCQRPLVSFENSHESIEKGLWFYGKNIMPLAAEDNLYITLMVAERYGVDSIVGDTESIKKLLSKAERYIDGKKIISIALVDFCFDADCNGSLRKYFPNAKITLVFSLSETGSLGLACEEKADGQTFHPSENTLIETDEHGYLVATQLIMRPTPIIKYRTRIKIKMEKKSCFCGSELSFSIRN